MANIVLSILGNDKTGPATKSAEGNLTRVQELAKRTKMLAAGVGLAAGAAVGAVLKTGFDEAKDGSAGMAQLEAGIKSTGGAAGVTVGHMEDLASSIQSMSGQTDDSIVGAEKLLLTFTNIKNNGPDKIFDQATQAAADMAARMGGDASSNAVRLGKALNDPVKGVSALTKVGVTFSDAQKATIASMVKTGDTAGAQKIILGELNKEFGGSAKAAGESLPGQLARAQRSFENLSQGVVEALLPIMSAVLPTLIAGIKAISPVLTDVAKWITANKGLIPVLAAAIGVLTVAFWALSLTPVALTFAAIVAGIAIVVTAVVLLITHWNDVVGFFRGIWAAVVTWFRSTLNSIGSWWTSTWNGVIGFFRTIWNNLVSFGVSVVRGYVSTVQSVFRNVVSFLQGILNGWLSFWRGLWNGLVSFGVSVVRGYVATVSGAFSGVVSFLRGIFNGFLSFWRGLWGNVTSFVSDIPGKIRGVFSGIGGWLVSSGRSLIDGFVSGIKSSVGAAVNAVSGVVNAVSKFFPHSPAPEGPFSGSGWTHYSGQALIDGFTGGMTSRASSAKNTVSGVLGGLVPSLSMAGLGLAGAAGSGAVVAGTGSGGISIGAINTQHGANASEIVSEISWQARRMPV